MPTSDVLPEMRVRANELVLIGEADGAAPAGQHGDTYVSTRRQRAAVVTASHVMRGSVSLYPGAFARAFLQASDPPSSPWSK